MEKGEERKWKERLDKEGAKNRKVKKKKNQTMNHCIMKA